MLDEGPNNLDPRHFLPDGVSDDLKPLHELGGLGCFNVIQLVLPSPLLHDPGFSREWLESVLLARARLVADVKPPPPPILGGVDLVQLKILNVEADRDPKTVDVEYTISTRLPLHLKDVFEKAPMGVNPQEALTQREENRKVENRIGRQLVKLNAVHEKKIAEEFMGGK